MAVQADEQHGRVVLEQVLRAVAVVDVPVEDQNALEVEFVAQRAGGDDDVVEQTEAHRAVALGVVTGRPDRAEGPPQPAASDLPGGLDHPAGGEPCDFIALGADGAVRLVDERLPSSTGLGHAIDVATVVDAGQ